MNHAELYTRNDTNKQKFRTNGIKKVSLLCLRLSTQITVVEAREILIKGSKLFKVMFAHNKAKKGHTYSIQQIGRCWQMHHYSSQSPP